MSNKKIVLLIEPVLIFELNIFDEGFGEKF